MKIYKTQKQVDRDIKDGVLKVDDDVIFDMDFVRINGNIIVIGDIIARDITAGNITARDIIAGDINAWDINAWDIYAGDIIAGNIIYFGVCFAYGDIKCKSIKGRHKNAKHFCLDGKITKRR